MSISTHEALSLSNLLRPEVRADPYPFYAELRSTDPVHWDESMGFWVLTRYADINSVYADSRFSRALGLRRGFERLSETEQKIAQPVYQSFSKTMFYSDPPYHTRLRGLVNNAFTPNAVEQMRPHVQRIVDSLLDEVEANGEMDAIREFAHPLPILVITQMLGLPSEDRWQFKKWSDDLFAILGSVPHAPELMDRAARSLAELTDYLTAMSDTRRQQPKNDLLSALVGVVEKGERLTQEELIANVTILLSAGHETTINLIGNGLLALLHHPEQLQKLRENPDLISSAVEEMMRYDNPVQIAYRSAAEDVEIGGKWIRKGQLVNSILAAGNRDPQRFSEPDRFDIARDEGRHLGLGLGIHFCLGAPLVRLEAQIAFSTILQRFPKLQLATEIFEWQEHPIFRGVNSLPLLFST
ncbi:MAG TPA: cytochrome P450 [Anaerolineales bacterium]|nr:cytochrome P450 [Anaerolineales bacterium]